MAYLLDTNVFIESRNRHYGFDICPGFWEWLERKGTEGVIRSIEQVQRELQDDELAEWAAARGDDFFLRSDAPMLQSLGAVSTWVTARSYEATAVAQFLHLADYYLVARAHAHGDIVVTQEVPSQGSRKVKIPDVCIGMNVQYMNTFDMLRAEHVKLVLG